MLYHLSTNGKLKVLTPRVPECAVSIYEENEVDETDIHYPTVDEVRDAKINHEVWVMREIKVQCVGVIQTENWDWTKRHNSGRGRVTFFHYPYEWIENKT